MNISDLLTFLFLSKESAKGLSHHKPKFSDLQKLEIKHLINCIEDYINIQDMQARYDREPNQVLTDEEEQWFAKLLSNRWDSIQSSNSSYTVDLKNPANVLCICIAKALAKQLDKKWFELLMPTVNGIANPLLVLEYEEKTDLSHFVMSDDNTQLIHIEAALQEFKFYGHMNKIVNGQPIPLSDSEKNRVIYRTVNTENYYRMLKEIRNLEHHKGTLGYALTQLKIALKQSSVDGDGTEFIAGTDVDIALQDVANLITSLPDKKILFNCRYIDTDNKIVFFKDIWDALTDYSISITNAVRCTKTIAAHIEGLLDNNHHLFHIKINDGHEVHIEANRHKDKNEIITKAFREEYAAGISSACFFFDKNTDLKLIPFILSSQIGVELFCKSKSNINFISKLAVDAQVNCIRTLLTFKMGKAYLEKAISSSPKYDSLKLIVEQIHQEQNEEKFSQHPTSSGSLLHYVEMLQFMKPHQIKLEKEFNEDEIVIESSQQAAKEFNEDEMLIEYSQQFEVVEEEDIEEKSFNPFVETIKPKFRRTRSQLSFSDIEVIEGAFGSNNERLTLAIQNSLGLHGAEDEKNSEEKQVIRQSPPLLLVSEDHMDLEITKKPMSFETESKRPPNPSTSVTLMDTGFDKPVKKWAKRKREETAENQLDQKPVKKARSDLSFFIPTRIIQTTLSDISSESVQHSLFKNQENHKAEYEQLLHDLDEAIKVRKFNIAFVVYDKAIDFLDKNKTNLDSEWHAEQNHILMRSKRPFLIKACEYHEERKREFLKLNDNLINQIKRAIKYNDVFEAFYYLHKDFKDFSKNKKQYSHEWYQERKLEIRSQIHQCMTYIIATNLNILKDRYKGEDLKNLKQWSSCLKSLINHFSSEMFNQKMIQDTLNKVDQILGDIEDHQNNYLEKMAIS